MSPLPARPADRPLVMGVVNVTPDSFSDGGRYLDPLLAVEHGLRLAADGADIEIEDCRWTPCYDCGVCPEMNTEIQIGPTGRALLPLSVV